MRVLNFSKGVFLVALLLAAISADVQAQYLRTSYFMEGTHYRQQLNPALAPGRGYVNLPVIGAFNATVNSSLGYQDVLDIIDNSDGGDYFMSDKFRKRLKDDNSLNLNLSTDIISAGWYKGKGFWSFNVGLRADMGASISRSMFDFMHNMNDFDANDVDSYKGLDETVGEQKLEINSYAEIGLGYARSINSRLTVGGRVKALLGIGNMKLTVNNIDVYSNLTGLNGSNDDWTNVRGNASIDVDATLESSFKGLELEESNDGYIDDFDFDAGKLGLAGYGLGIDLGATYKLMDNLTVSASILDLGFIKWSKGATTVARAGAEQNYDLSNPSDRRDFADLVSSGEVLNYDMLELQKDKDAAKSRTSSLTSTLVLGAEYSLLNNWLVVGALYTGRFAKPKALNELTLSANIRPKNYFNVALSYSMLQSAGTSFGLAVKLGPLFVGTDYMFLGKSSKSVNGFLGISIPLNKKKKAETTNAI